MTDVLDELRGFCNGKTETVYTRAVAEIERLREATRWRSVAEEGYPPGNEDVLATFPRNKRWCYRTMRRIPCEDHKGRMSNHWELAGDYVDDDIPSQSDPTHWQPLPEPPK